MKTHRLALRSDDFLVCHTPPPKRPPSGGLWECLATHGQQQRLTCLLGIPLLYQSPNFNSCICI